MLLVDSHCHLNFPDYKEDLEAVISRALEAGVRVMQTICTKMEEFDEVLAIAEAHEGIYCSVGVHPNNVGDREIVTVEALVEKCAHPKVIGLGETGLDAHYYGHNLARQEESFLRHIEASRITGLPVIIHTRDAERETVRIVEREMQKQSFRALIHCFSGTPYLAEKMIESGLYISFSGIVTFKNAIAVREGLALVPPERILLETDAPYLAPTPYRGKRNEPSYIMYINKLISEAKNINEEQSAAITTKNFFDLFTKAKVPEAACA